MRKQCVFASVVLLVTLAVTTVAAQTIYTVTATNARLNREVTGDVVAEVIGDDGTAVPAEPVDAFVWDGVGSTPIAAANFHLEVDPIANTGEINVKWTDENGMWEMKQTAFAPPPHPTGLRVSPDAMQTELVGGDPIVTNVFLHGNTGAAPPVLPTIFNLLATWGPGEITLNGQPFNNPFDGPAPRWVTHTMTTPGVRNPDGTVRTTKGDIYVGPNPDGTPMTVADGVTDWDDMEVHFTWHDAPGPMTGNTPPPFSFFYHVVFEDVKVEIRHGSGDEAQDFSNVFFMSLSEGLNMISLPLKPQTPHTARSFAEEIGATTVIQLDEKTQRFVGFTLDAPDDGFSIEGGKGYIVNVPEKKQVAFVGGAWTNFPSIEAAPPLAVGSSDGAWAFVVSGRLGQSRLDTAGYLVTVRNTRTGAVATDVVRSGYFAAAFASLSRQSVVEVSDRLEVTVRDRTGEIASEPIQITVTPEALRQAFLPIILKNLEKPSHSLLLQNYPNPFNPETWMPYQLQDSAAVAIHIYDAQGGLVRTLSLGHRAAGFYQSRSRAAYWDGRNDAGESVASGVYFYQLRAGDFSATRRMLILK